MGGATDREEVLGTIVRSGVLFCGITVVEGEGTLGGIRPLVGEGEVILLREGWNGDRMVNAD
jgi:hypothetical protein